MFECYEDETLVPFKGKIKIEDFATKPDKNIDKEEYQVKLKEQVDEIAKEQGKLYADNRFSLLLIFQALDAAGKDSTIKAVLSGVNPAGCSVYPFKKPTDAELDHDFLWRTNLLLPERGKIGVFNRSYYEEVLVVRVHPELLQYQRLPYYDEKTIWNERLESIADHEKHLARNGYIILKFWLNVSRDEQKKRFLDRLNDPKKNWKFEKGDLYERQHWNDYLHAYEQIFEATSRRYAPWYAIPADDKAYMRYKVAKIVAKTLDSLDLKYPKIEAQAMSDFQEYRAQLENEKN